MHIKYYILFAFRLKKNSAEKQPKWFDLDKDTVTLKTYI